MIELNRKKINLRSFFSAFRSCRMLLVLAWGIGCIAGQFAACFAGRHEYSAQLVLLGWYDSVGVKRSFSADDTAAAAKFLSELSQKSSFRSKIDEFMFHRASNLDFTVKTANIPGEIVVVISGSDRAAVSAGVFAFGKAVESLVEVPDGVWPPDMKLMIWHQGETVSILCPALPLFFLYGSAGGILGLLAGCIGSLIWIIQDKSISNIHELEKQFALPVLGVLPQNSIAPSEGDRTSAQIYWKAVCSLRDHLDYCRPLRGTGGILQITDLESNPGKSLLAADLAMALARQGDRVLLVDADYRRSRNWGFACTETAGLNGVIAGTASLNDAVQRSINGWPLDVLVRGADNDNPAALLRSRSFEDFLQQAAGIYDCILLDAPPLLGFSDALIIGKLADHTLLILDCRRCCMEKLHLALWRMRKAHVNICGMAINFFQLRNRRHYYYNYQYSFYKAQPR